MLQDVGVAILAGHGQVGQDVELEVAEAGCLVGQLSCAVEVLAQRAVGRFEQGERNAERAERRVKRLAGGTFWFVSEAPVVVLRFSR